METIKLPKFKAREGKLFFPELKRKIDFYFDRNRKNKTANLYTYAKAFILIFAYVSTYFLIILGNQSTFFTLTLWMFLGIVFACIGFNIMHDAGHGSYSKHEKVNYFLFLSLNLVGANAFLWETKHNWLHHRFTNLDGIDEDIDIPFMRVHTNQKWEKYHKYQYIYAFPLYTVTYFLWVWYADFKKYFSGKIHGQDIGEIPLSEHFIFWLSKFFYIFYIIVVPIYFLGFWKFFFGYLLLCATCGLFISVIFQLAHVVEGVDNPITDQDNQIKQEWAVHQIQSTSNFATSNWFVTLFTGGLNFQTEHHLFPEINHIHYPKIKPIVKEHCKEFGITYNEKSTFLDAIVSHVNYLETLGTKP
jgi:linoleoyl-CoA desaturase